MKRVAIIASMRTPFVKTDKKFKELGPLNLDMHSVQGLLDKTKLIYK
ncbi:MAG: hypothetical protein ACE1ZQ_01690 [Ignavibacteriaceae bacterium]